MKPTEKVIAKRRKQGEALTAELLKQLKNIIPLAKDTKLRLTRSSLEVFVLESEDKTRKLFGSDVEFSNNDWLDDKDNLKMSLCSMGSFDPTERSSTVRTLHAAQFLTKWEETSKIILAFMNQLKNMEKVWKFENKNL